MDTSIIEVEEVNNEFAIMPVMNVLSMAKRRQMIVEVTREIMEEGKHYGTIPGTDKPTLYKSGAELLATVFGLSPRFEIVLEIEDWTGADHDGESFFYYKFRCKLYRGVSQVGEGLGSANSWEKKYRFRSAKRVCPECGNSTIFTSSQERGGGFYCWKKKDGCGATFPADDERITSQSEKQIPNPDIADQVNTILKMSQKRALVASILTAVNASEFFSTMEEDHSDFIASEEARQAFKIGDTVDVTGESGEIRRGKVTGFNGRLVTVRVDDSKLSVNANRLQLVAPATQQQKREIDVDATNDDLFGDRSARNQAESAEIPAPSEETPIDGEIVEEEDESEDDVVFEDSPEDMTDDEKRIFAAKSAGEFYAECLKLIPRYKESRTNEIKTVLFGILGYERLDSSPWGRVMQYRFVRRYALLRDAGKSKEDAVSTIDSEELPF